MLLLELRKCRAALNGPLAAAVAVVCGLLVLCGAARPAVAATTTCSVATSLAAHELCWLDWTGYTFTAGYTSPFVITLPDGSRLTGTITNTGTTTDGTTVSLPTIVRATQQPALGASDGPGEGGYLGITGKPGFYTTGPTAPIRLSNLQFTNAAGTAVGGSVTVAGADAEDTSAADYDGGVGGIYWTTTGSNLVDLQLIPQNSTTTSMCTISGVGTGAAKCLSVQNQPDPGSAYILTSTLTNAQAFTMSAQTSTVSAEGFAFGVQLAEVKAIKNVASRIGTDQFTVSIANAGSTGYSATTTGTGTGVQGTTGGAVVPGAAYTVVDATTNGSHPISQYATTLTCTNATSGSATTLPAAGSAVQTATITPAIDDNISCTYTNTGLTVSVAPVNATATYNAGISETDSFTLTNTSSIAGTIAVTAPTITSSAGGTITPTAYTFGGNSYGTVASLNAAIAAAGTTAAGGTITVGVVYTPPTSASAATDTVTVPATVSSGTGTSAVASGSEADTVPALPTMTSGSNCYVATSANQHLICWIDFAGYEGLGSEAFSLRMPDGSILTGTVNNTGSVSSIPTASPYAAKAAFGNTTYIGINGEPIFVIGATSTASPIVISNLKLTDPLGFSVSTVGMAGTDAEDTNTPGFGIQEMMYWATTGAPWTLLQTQIPPSGSTTTCTLTALPAQNVTCSGVSGTNIDDYMLRTIVNTVTSGSAQSFSMSGITSYNQAWAYGINLSLLTATKTVSTRVAAADQFTVAVGRATNGANPVATGAPIVSASTSGTGTTATATTPYYVIPNDNYVLSESMAAGSPSLLSQYATTVNCTNAMPTAGVTQVLPAANTPAQSVIILPQPDAVVTCAFTNTAVTLTNTAVTPTATDPMSTSETDSFTLKNTSAIPATFTVAAPTITPFNGTTAGTAFAPTGYTLTVGTSTTSYTTLAALNTAIAGMTPTAVGGSIVVGVTYTTSTAASTSDVVTLPATDSSGTGTSAVAVATETDTIMPSSSLAIVKTGTTQTSPGGLITYTILVTNNGPSPATGASFSDPMPTGVTVTGTPTCATTTGAAVCGAVNVSGTNPQTVSSTLGAFPNGSSVTFTITATAAAAGNYTNMASISEPSGTTGSPATSSLTTAVAQANGLVKTVQNITQNGTAGSSNTAKPNDVLQYVLTFINSTGASIYGLIVGDLIPANTTYSATPNAVTCVVNQTAANPPPCAATFTATPAKISGTLPTKASGGNPLAPGGTVTVTFRVIVN